MITNGDILRKLDDLAYKLTHRRGSYNVNLAELIGLVVDEDNLAEIIKSVDYGFIPNKKRLNRPEQDTTDFFASILHAEIDRQFTSKQRPFLELVLNSIDAKPKDFEGEYNVLINSSTNSFTVEDQGEGMGLKTILTTLLIPYSSSRNELEDIGRFGVGFFSALQYCVDVSGTKLEILTGNKEHSYQISIESEGTVESLRANIKKVKGGHVGTKIKISRNSNSDSSLLDDNFSDYLEKYFNFFDGSVASIIESHDGFISRLNEDSGDGRVWHRNIRTDLSTVFDTSEGKLEQKVRLQIQPTAKNTITYYSQGIFIKELPIGEGNLSVKIDFPSAITVVEGRDDLKYDSKFGQAIVLVEDYLMDIMEKEELWCLDSSKQDFKKLMALVPKIGNKTHWDGFNRERIVNAFVKHYKTKPYLMLSESESNIKGDESLEVSLFFGNLAKDCFMAAQDVYRYYDGHLPNFSDLLVDNTVLKYETDSLSKLKKHAKKLPGIRSLTKINKRSNSPINYKLVSLKESTHGALPFCSTMNSEGDVDVYINNEHPVLIEDRGHLLRYAIKLFWIDSFTSRGEKVENIILSDGDDE